MDVAPGSRAEQDKEVQSGSLSGKIGDLLIERIGHAPSVAEEPPLPAAEACGVFSEVERVSSPATGRHPPAGGRRPPAIGGAPRPGDGALSRGDGVPQPQDGVPQRLAAAPGGGMASGLRGTASGRERAASPRGGTARRTELRERDSRWR